MQIVSVRMAHDQHYAVPAEVVEMWDGGKALVRFAAGNMRFVDPNLLVPATDADRKEFTDSQAAWTN
jgi:hypothetical protein